jgi:hypothetical protein
MNLSSDSTMEHALHFEKFYSEFFLNIKDIVRKKLKESAAEPSEVNLSIKL